MDIETFANYVALAWEYVKKSNRGEDLTLELSNKSKSHFTSYHTNGCNILNVNDPKTFINNKLDGNQHNFEDLFRMFLAMCADLKRDCGGIGDCDHCVARLYDDACIKNCCANLIFKNYAVFCGDVKITKNMWKSTAETYARTLQNVEVRKVN